MLGILYALGPAGELRQKLVGDALRDLRRRPGVNREAGTDLRTLAREAVASVFSYDGPGDFRAGWEYLSSDLKTRRGCEEWRIKTEEERRAVPRAVFLPTGTGEVFMGGDGDLAVIEVFGINTEFTGDGGQRESRGTVLAGFIYSDGRWLLQSASWYPEHESDRAAALEQK
jgi:hypothetical protein